MKIAVVGAGIAGLGAAHALAPRHQVTLFEASGRLGGHARTRDISVGGQTIPVDTGFIVYNESNYPLLTRLFSALGVRTARTDMSFSVSLDRGRIEYLGSPRGILVQPRNLLRPSYVRMISEIRRFYRQAPGLLALAGEDPTLGEYLAQNNYSRAFSDHHILPMGAAIWSAPIDTMRGFPAKSFVRFFVNHNLFDLTARPPWRTVIGGSRTYVDLIAKRLAGCIRMNAPVTGLRRSADAIHLRAGDQPDERFDHVILATHADQALAVLGCGASEQERAILGPIRYQANHAVLHSDPTLMPRRKRAWASWNYLAESGSTAISARAPCVSYWMNRLQRLPIAQPVVVTLNPDRALAPETIHDQTTFHHPQFDNAAVTARARLSGIQGANRTWFCGSYCGDGFHEDGLRSAVTVAAALDAPAPWAADAVDASPADHVPRHHSAALAAE